MFTHKASRPLPDGTGDAHTWKADHGWLTFEASPTLALVRLTAVFVKKAKLGKGLERQMLLELLGEMPDSGHVDWPDATDWQLELLQDAIKTFNTPEPRP